MAFYHACLPIGSNHAKFQPRGVEQCGAVRSTGAKLLQASL